MKKFLDGLKSIPGDIVVVHSGYMPFRKLVTVEGMVDILQDVFSDRKLVMPAYTSDFPKTGKFDVVRSKPYTGAICETYMRRAERTHHAMNSYLHDGFLPPLTDGWGAESVMQYLWKKNATFVSLGVPTVKSCSYFHLAEVHLGVPYRYEKVFKGAKFMDGRKVDSISTSMYVGPRECPQNFYATKADNLLTEWGLKHFRSGFEGGSPHFEWAEMKHIVFAAKECLRKDPYSLLTNGEEVRQYVENHGIERELGIEQT